MSNPGVLILSNANCAGTRFKRFQIEDNIGESIHLHIDNFRFDFSVNEFIQFSSSIEQTLLDELILKDAALLSLDLNFLGKISPLLLNVVRISYEKIQISKLEFIVRSHWLGFDWLALRRVTNTPAFKYLQGVSSEFLTYRQSNEFGVNNEDRLLTISQSISNSGLDEKKGRIVLMGSRNIVRDGQHRLSAMAHIYGEDSEVTVMRIHLKGNSHEMNLFILNTKSFLKNTVKCIIRIARKYSYFRRKLN